ncbi:hypothetical protein ACEUBF_03395 [Aeromonas caviae]|uniref:hypothetical protein n=1 Tax=Aeromonas caviae TaxID=648 RepID=UPI0038D0CF0D
MMIELDKPKTECLFEFEDVQVKYKFRRGKQDRQHLLVVFSGFGGANPIAYDFDGQALSECRSNVLWIKDDFFGKCAYYLCRDMDFSIEHAVIALIDAVLRHLELTRIQCTLYGASKGGSAALYYGIKYDFNKIIASCPQIKIGSYCSTNAKAHTELQIHESKENTDYLDRLIPDLLAHDKNKNKNIYLISSPQDEQYQTEVYPFLSLFEKYDNFNFIFTNSALAWQHNTISRYNVPIILSIIYAHGESITPHFGKVSNGIPLEGWESNTKLIAQRKKNQPVAMLQGAKLNDSIFFPKGVAFVRGYPCPDFGILSRKLILRSDKTDYSFAIGAIKDKMVSYTFYEETYCDYQAAAFASVGQKGIDLSSLPCGSYRLLVEIQIKNEQLITTLTGNQIDIKSINGPYEYRVYSDNVCAFLVKKDMRKCPQQGIFRIHNSWQKDWLIHYDGVFIVPGVELEKWGDAKYYLLLTNDQHNFSYNLGMSHRPELNEELGGHSIYQKAYFSTIGNKGIDISDLPLGRYDAYILISYKSSLFSQKIEHPTYKYISKIEQYENTGKNQHIFNIQKKISHWHFDDAIDEYIEVAHSNVDLLLTDCYRLMAEMGKFDEIIHSIEHLGLSFLKSKISNPHNIISNSQNFFIDFYENQFLPSKQGIELALNDKYLNLLYLLINNDINRCNDLISDHENGYISDKIAELDGMILIYAVNRLVSMAVLKVETAIKIVDSMLTSNNLSDTSKKYLVSTVIHYCLSTKRYEFFTLRASYYNHIQKVAYLFSKHIDEPGAIRLYEDFNRLINKYNNTAITKKPRVAVCISGMIRGNAHSLKSIYTNIVEQLDADVFIHTWDVYHSWPGICGGPKTTWSPRLFGKKVRSNIPEQILDFNNFKSKFPKSAAIIEAPVEHFLDQTTLNSFIRYTSAVIENQDDFIYSLGEHREQFKSRGNYNQAKMFYGIHSAAEQVVAHEEANNIKYDYILRLRTDCTILSPLSLNDINTIDENQISIGMSAAVGPNDGFFICKRDTYLTISSLWEASFTAKKLSPFEQFPMYDAHALFFLWMVHHNIVPVKSTAREDYHQATVTAPCPIQLSDTIIEEFNSQTDLKEDTNYQSFIKIFLDVIENEKNCNRS